MKNLNLLSQKIITFMQPAECLISETLAYVSHVTGAEIILSLGMHQDSVKMMFIVSKYFIVEFLLHNIYLIVVNNKLFHSPSMLDPLCLYSLEGFLWINILHSNLTQ